MSAAAAAAAAAMRRSKVAPISTQHRQGSLPADHPDGAGLKLDVHAVSSVISNGEDLAPLVRRAFASGRPEALLQSLRHFSREKDREIEDVCKAHYQDFIRAVDDLRSLLSDVDSLKSSLSDANSLLQSAGGPVLLSLDAYLDALSQSRNLSLALSSSLLCVRLLDLCSRANSHLSSDNLYMALRCIDAIERGGFLDSAPSPSIRRMLESTIPAVRAHAERRIARDFSDWLVRIRVVSRSLGQLAISRASAARQRDEELRARQRLAEEQSRRSSPFDPPIYTLHLEDDDDDDDVAASANSGLEGGPLDLTPLFRAFHIHRTLGLEDRFRKYYFENRKLQLTSDFQVSSMTPFLESHQTFFSQIAGFFIVEDRVLRTGGGGLISRLEVDSLWEAAVSKMVSVLVDQFSRMHTANHLLLVKDYVGLLAVTLRRYGYAVDALLDVLSRHADKYHELLMSDCRKQISEALAADELSQMVMHREYEYTMHVLSFQLQTSEIAPAYPFVAPFSSSVPDCCRIVRSFIEDSVNFHSHGGQLDFYDAAVRKHLDRLLSEVLDAALLSLVEASIHGVSQAMQVAANMVVFERACDFFHHHAAHLSGMPPRMVDRVRREFPLTRARDATEGLLLGLVRAKIDEFMVLIESVNWVADDPPPDGNEYANEVFIYLETWVSTAWQILPVQVLMRVLRGVLVNISDKIIGAFLSDSVRRFNASAVTGMDTDLKMFELFIESFINRRSSLFPGLEEESGLNELRTALLEARQLVNLLLSNNPENFLNPVIRERHYNKLDYKKVLAILEKFKDSSDGLFGSFSTRAARQNPKKRSLDTLIKRLKDAT